jgi:hypothetical protein
MSAKVEGRREVVARDEVRRLRAEHLRRHGDPAIAAGVLRAVDAAYAAREAAWRADRERIAAWEAERRLRS